MRITKNQVSADYRIIILDDEPGIIDSLSVMLKRSGYYYTGTTDPLEAIEMIRDQKFDMLILDYLMYPIHGR